MSWQLRLLNAQLRLLVKPRVGRTQDPEEAARSVERASRVAVHPPFLRFQERPGGLFWISCGPCAPRRVLLYFHGGGYVAGSPRTHRAMLGILSRMAGVEVVAPYYPLLQDKPFPAPFDAAEAAWRRLAVLGYRPRDVVLGGDSAGGGIALALLSALCQRQEAPAGAVVFSPWVDLAMTGASLRDNAALDPLLPADRVAELTEMFLAGADPRDPRASPLYADFPGCPPVRLTSSRTEILFSEIGEMARRLEAAGAQVSHEVHPSAPHAWPLFQGWLPEADDTLARAARFVQASFDDGIR
ncbi:alpha/beta hydrolase [Sagittula stellata]|uniref:Lipolytic enzyme n=1 Tax=Sagittula stellata (strain ATCC 700073 / DSM 11524 / E-37) TaxID=388399 RepID=A3K992_SAGS3|nr:alpha/beta hydrolase [Sagittula stellata]EBA06264.1 Lipolytic enzyme [Sagittula stellata E-37]